jgi:hypothetical protein
MEQPAIETVALLLARHQFRTNLLRGFLAKGLVAGERLDVPVLSFTDGLNGIESILDTIRGGRIGFRHRVNCSGPL